MIIVGISDFAGKEFLIGTTGKTLTCTGGTRQVYIDISALTFVNILERR
jgi:hypothetical protein